MTKSVARCLTVIETYRANDANPLESMMAVVRNSEAVTADPRKASRVAFQALSQIRAARALAVMLRLWTGRTFDSSKLVPGAVLDALIDLGVDEVIDLEDENLSHTLAEWLGRASEAGFQKAWPGYARILRRSPEGVDPHPDVALRWARASADGGDAAGSLELALLLIENTGLEQESGEGERLLRKLASGGMVEARFELGKRWFEGNGLPEAARDGFGLLIEAAEAGHSKAWMTLFLVGYQWWIMPTVNFLVPSTRSDAPILVPDWAAEFKDRWWALFSRKR